MTKNCAQAWANNPQEKNDFEAWMENVYPEHWAVMIDRMIERDLTAKTVLDFGCNRGGFLQLLYRKKPFMHGVGIDLDTEAIHIAESRKGDLPLTFENRDNISHLNNAIDFAFSHEVFWLMEDITPHAAEMSQALKPGGSITRSTAITPSHHWTGICRRGLTAQTWQPLFTSIHFMTLRPVLERKVFLSKPKNLTLIHFS